MIKQKAFKLLMKPTNEQIVKLSKTFGCVRFIYNKMLEDRIKAYEATGKSKRFTPASYKAEYGFLKEVDSLALCNAQLHLETAFNNFFRDKNVGFPKWKKRHGSKKSYTTNYVNNNIQIKDGILKLPKVGKVKIKCHRNIPDSYKLKSVTITQKASGKFEASILFEYEFEIYVYSAEKCIGLDYSQKELFVDSEGNSPQYPHYYRQMEEKISREKRKLSKMQQKSSNWCKQKQKIAKMEEKVKNQRNDFLHKLSTQIANEYDVVCVEDINLHSLSQTLHLGKNLCDNGFGRFREFLSYKLEERGKLLVKIDKWYASSKLCSHCGAYNELLKLNDRVYRCPHCGAIMDRDHNAAMNIQRKGYESIYAY